MQTNKQQSRLILASCSVYRRELLARLQFNFESIAPELDESPRTGESPKQTALRLAHEKAKAIAKNHPEAIIIGSDQVATLDGLQIGKPGNHAAALKQLQLMRGREVAFHTALCVLDSRQHAPSPVQIQDICTMVRFRDLSDAELDAYLRIEQPYDCAGSAKNEGLGIAIIQSIKSDDPTALTGLPLIALTSMLRNTGLSFFHL
ncbi:MAG: septum formation protein Maf [Burkholderiales bacterium]|nr:septum formation protein Maf [Burkholderiales bacterium]MBI3731060.1 septum formation protein Maf [Burkholderiales bacterium]